MAFSIEKYAALRPTLWHLTHRENLDSIRKSRVLMSARQLTSNETPGPRRNRQTSSGIVLRDQNFLHEKCIAFELGSSMGDFLNELERRVFFWSGWRDRPIKPARRAINLYASSDVIIRVPFLDAAQSLIPYFSCCNLWCYPHATR